MEVADKHSILSEAEIGDCECLTQWPRPTCPLGGWGEREPSTSQQHAFAIALLCLFVHYECLHHDFDILPAVWRLEPTCFMEPKDGEGSEKLFQHLCPEHSLLRHFL